MTNNFLAGIRLGTLALCLLLCSHKLSAAAMDEGISEELAHAARVMKGIDSDQTQEWAVAVVRNSIEQDSVPYAMNILGLAHLAGKGVDKDSTLADYWLRKAGDNGYPEAYHNLGMMYKNARCGVAQNFPKAAACFSQGVQKGSVVCMYDEGYMLYKGLGCMQDYEKAAELFAESAAKEYSPSLYMLGLCYRNGYGVERDEQKAKELLDRSAMLSFKPAMEELMRPNPENFMSEDSKETLWDIPESMPEIATDVNDISLLNGNFRGYIVMYDWSGNHLLAEKPVSMSIHASGNDELGGLLLMGNDSIPFKAAVSADGRLRFSEGSVRMNDRYSRKKVSYRMSDATLDIWQDRLTGRLALYSLKDKEPDRPMFISLERIGADGKTGLSGDRAYERVTATPNPFAYSFNAIFELKQPADAAHVRIFDKYGMMVYTTSIRQIPAGKQSVSITPTIAGGEYVLDIRAGKQVFRTIIVKKGGEQ